ncbi:MAG TPA: L-threonylcarbamoyladenylate synthase [Acidimicrobiales bacterium]|nr:L-threonylcarbamoyladenylate synthase [Acidimicrobiales bacterium]
MAIVPASGDPPPAAAISAAVEALSGGDIVGVPTDTVYGLAADPFRSGATDRLFRAKGRPRNIELPVLVANETQAAELTVAVPEVARRLMARYWPGPLTLVLPRRPDLAADLGEDDATVGIRCPDHPVPLAICEVLGPVATTSANRHGDAPLTTACDLVDAFGALVELVLDAGVCNNPPSTVVDATGDKPRLLREGALTWADVLAAADGRSPAID